MQWLNFNKQKFLQNMNIYIKRINTKQTNTINQLKILSWHLSNY